MKLVEKTRGAVIHFGGLEYHVARKPVAHRMMAKAKPVWSAKPRLGYSVVKLEDEAIGHTDLIPASTGSVASNPEWAVGELADHYLSRLEAACQPKSRKAGL